MTGDGPLTGRARAGRLLFWLCAGVLFFALGFVSSWTRGVNITDESWFLQVLNRVAGGDVLYRDVFFGVTPLSVYLTLIPVSIFGAELLVVKAVMALCYAVTILLSARISRQLGLARAGQFLLVGACLVFILPDTTSAYKAFAQVFFLLCFTTLLAWLDGSAAAQPDPDGWKSARSVLLCGLFSGLCFLCYQTWGLYTLAALLSVILAGSSWRSAEGRARLLRRCLLAGGGFALTAFIFLLPVWFSGGMPAFIDYGFLNKSTYVETAGHAYLDNLQLLLPFFTLQTWDRFRLLYQNSLFLLPPVAFYLLAFDWWRKQAGRRQIVFCVLVFTGSAFLTVFPRADWPHYLYAIPTLLLGIAFAWQDLNTRTPRAWTRLLQVAVLCWIALGLVTELVTTTTRLETGDYRPADLAHFHGALFPSAQYTAITNSMQTLKQAGAAGSPVLVLPEAGFYYLITGLHDPTPFDYPLVTAFGRHGEQDLVTGLAQRRFAAVCLRSLSQSSLGALRPALVEDYVLAAMRPTQDLGVCTLYAYP